MDQDIEADSRETNSHSLVYQSSKLSKKYLEAGTPPIQTTTINGITHMSVFVDDSRHFVTTIQRTHSNSPELFKFLQHAA